MKPSKNRKSEQVTSVDASLGRRRLPYGPLLLSPLQCNQCAAACHTDNPCFLLKTNLREGLVSDGYSVADHVPDGLFAVKRQQLAALGLAIPAVGGEAAHQRDERRSWLAMSLVLSRQLLMAASQKLCPYKAVTCACINGSRSNLSQV